MTIAACYVSPEGVVLGADGTTTNYVPHPSKPIGETHHFNFGQKILEVGENSTTGIASWGLGSLGTVSYRTIVAQLGDEFKKAPLRAMEDIRRILGNIEAIDFGPDSRPSWFKPAKPSQ